VSFCPSKSAGGLKRLRSVGEIPWFESELAPGTTQGTVKQDPNVR